MLREGNTNALTWADKTMSVIRTRQLEACEQRLMALPEIGLFAEGIGDKAEELWRISYDAQELPPSGHLHTAQELQGKLMIQLPAEAALLTFQEEQLVERLLSMGGETYLLDWDELDAAESLVRRLWCTIVRGEEHTLLRMPTELITPLMLVMSSKQHTELREKLLQFNAHIQAVLYLNGLLSAEQALDLLLHVVLANTYADDDTLALRFLRCSFDYAYDQYGSMMLLHPGLADPERLLQGRSILDYPTGMPEDISICAQAANGILAEEQPLYDQMLGLLHHAVRPELTADDAVEDLRMLAKQGVSLQGMYEVLSSLLILQPTDLMRAGVKNLHDFTPIWGALHTGVVQ